MKNAISERLQNLIDTARRLQVILDAEVTLNPLPIMPLCRVALDTDHAVNLLEQHAEQLRHVREGK
jgi:hypothetical protein